MSETQGLAAYLQKPDASFAWEVQAQSESGSGTRYDLRLTSQTWQGITWTHTLQVFVPKTPTSTETALLYNTGWDGTMHDALMAEILAEQTGLTIAFLFHVPNQPLFDNLIEDGLIAHTFSWYIDTNEPDWPLLLPMVKSVVRAMDAVQALGKTHNLPVPTRFIVSGASKRGWTAWLTAAVDTRVAAIIPMVFDNLNFFAQMPHQVKTWGNYSAQIDDYTELKLQEKMATERGQALTLMVDPYTYRERLTLPKLLIHGANDPYWTTDAINLYWDGLQGPKWVLDVPNSGHGLDDFGRVLNTAVAFVRAIAQNRSLPSLTWSFQTQEQRVHVRIESDTPATEARLWSALAPRTDFRNAEWRSTPMTADNANQTIFTASLPIAATEGLAIFGEIGFSTGDHDYTLSTQPYVATPTEQ